MLVSLEDPVSGKEYLANPRLYNDFFVACGAYKKKTYYFGIKIKSKIRSLHIKRQYSTAFVLYAIVSAKLYDLYLTMSI